MSAMSVRTQSRPDKDGVIAKFSIFDLNSGIRSYRGAPVLPPPGFADCSAI
jgi:hypothetical protein